MKASLRCEAFFYFESGLFLEGSGDVLLSHVENDAVPSALKGFTAVFGMGTGGSPSP